jgi:hypothetical protein
VLVVARDITKRKRVEVAMLEYSKTQEQCVAERTKELEEKKQRAGIVLVFRVAWLALPIAPY